MVPASAFGVPVTFTWCPSWPFTTSELSMAQTLLSPSVTITYLPSAAHLLAHAESDIFATSWLLAQAGSVTQPVTLVPLSIFVSFLSFLLAAKPAIATNRHNVNN